MSEIDPNDGPAQARKNTVHDAWRAWREVSSAAPAARPAVSDTILGESPTVRQALQDWPAEAVRWCMLATHPSEPLPWGEAALQQALVELSHLYEARQTGTEMEGLEPALKVAHALGTPAWDALNKAKALRGAVSASLSDGFDTGHALASIADMARAINRFANHKQSGKRGAPIVMGALEALEGVARPLGLLGDDIQRFRNNVARKRLPARGLSPGQVEAMIDDRATARRARDWAQADLLRKKLDDAGIVVLDDASGSSWRVRP